MQEEENKNKSELEEKLLYKIDYAWTQYSEEQKDQAKEFSKEYLNFLENARTERERVKYIIELIKKEGFKEIQIGEGENNLKSGDKVYYNNRGKNLAIFIIGQELITKRSNFIGAHMDCPRIDLKIKPLYEDSKTGFALLKTHYYGGIKKYQWATVPLALTGVVILRNGKKVEIEIGKNKEDPIFMIPDLLVHLSSTVQGKRTMKDVIKATEMNVLVGAIPVEDEKVKEKFKINVLKILNEKYGIIEEDFHSAELSLVPAIKPRYMGLDKSMIAGAGQDDGSCTFFAIKALLDLKEPPKNTAIVGLFDKEETGSNGATGAQSTWIQQVVTDLMIKTNITENLSNQMATFRNAKMLSSDVTAAMDPSFKSVHDPLNAAIFGKGVVLEKYSGAGGKYRTSDATAEYVAEVIKILKDAEVPFQMGNLGEVDVGGGGTIAMFFAQNFNADIIDIGPSVINMHSPYEGTHIADLFATYLAYIAFLTS